MMKHRPASSMACWFTAETIPTATARTRTVAAVSAPRKSPLVPDGGHHIPNRHRQVMKRDQVAISGGRHLALALPHAGGLIRSQ